MGVCGAGGCIDWNGGFGIAIGRSLARRLVIRNTTPKTTTQHIAYTLLYLYIWCSIAQNTSHSTRYVRLDGFWGMRLRVVREVLFARFRVYMRCVKYFHLNTRWWFRRRVEHQAVPLGVVHGSVKVCVLFGRSPWQRCTFYRWICKCKGRTVDGQRWKQGIGVWLCCSPPGCFIRSATLVDGKQAKDDHTVLAASRPSLLSSSSSCFPKRRVFVHKGKCVWVCMCLVEVHKYRQEDEVE